MADFDVAAKLEAYRGELGAQVNAIGEKSPLEDYRQPYLGEAAVSGDDAVPFVICRGWRPWFRAAPRPLALVATEAQAELPSRGRAGCRGRAAKITISSGVESIGVNPKKAVVVADDESRSTPGAGRCPRPRPT